jgi:hypothetical protein
LRVQLLRHVQGLVPGVRDTMDGIDEIIPGLV